MTIEQLKDLEPFDMVLYTPTNEEGIVKSTNSQGAFVLFRIQSTANFCDAKHLEKL